MSSIRNDAELAALLDFSAEIGRDPLRTQAAGGNTSLKRDGILWIKASGMWLADAATKDIMIPVRLDPLRAAIASGDERAEKAIDFVVPGQNRDGLRPSVETPVHAAMPQAVVIHIHCVATIAVAARKDAPLQLAQRLRKVSAARWAFVPYVHPGLPLSHAVAALPAGTNAIVLGNHGLVVAVDTVAAAERLLDEIRAALEVSGRPSSPPDTTTLARLAEGSPYRLPRDPAAHDVATDEESLVIARRGTLYPDHVVFLGPGIVVLPEEMTPAEFVRRRVGAGRAPPPMLVVPGAGVLLHREALHGADELARALADVTRRIDPDVETTCIAPQDAEKLVNWEAEKYRLSLARNRQPLVGD